MNFEDLDKKCVFMSNHWIRLFYLIGGKEKSTLKDMAEILGDNAI